MSHTFVSEPITPDTSAMQTRMMASGAPAPPNTFRWRDQSYKIQGIIDQWKESAPCKHSGTEMYLRKHWFHIRTTDGSEMKIYFERQARSKAQKKQRWWLYTIETP